MEEVSSSSLGLEFQTYNFHPLTNLKFSRSFGSSKMMMDYLKKWCIYDGLQIQGFSFDQPFKSYLQHQFVQDFFSNPNVTSSFQRLTFDSAAATAKWEPIGSIGSSNLKSDIEIHEIKCTSTSLGLFDKLWKDECIIYTSSPNGVIKKCLDQYFKPSSSSSSSSGDPVLISNQLQKLIIKNTHADNEHDVDDDEYYDEDEGGETVSYDEEKLEFIFKLFGHLVLGGSLCQYEDTLKPYLDVTRSLYKDLISVAVTNKNPGSASMESQPQLISTTKGATGDGGQGQGQDKPGVDQLQVNSIVLQIIDKSNPPFIFRKSQINNFLYLIIDPSRRICYTLYHQIL